MAVLEALCRSEEVPSWALALAGTWETYQVNLFLESPLPHEGDWSEENLVLKACQLLLSQLKSRSWDLHRGLGFMPPKAMALTRSCSLGPGCAPERQLSVSGKMELLGPCPRGVSPPVWGSWWDQGPGARSPLGSCGSAWSTFASGPRAGPRWHRVCCRWTAAAGSAGRAWGRGHPAPGGNRWTWSGWWPSAT